MQCAKCRLQSVCFQRYSGRHLCAEHLCADIEARAKRVIRQHHWLVSGDLIGVCTGMAHADVLQIFLERLLIRRTDIRIITIRNPDGITMLNDQYDWTDLIRYAEQAGVTRIALPDTAEDLAVRALTALFQSDIDLLLDRTVPGLTFPIMQPFREIPEQELILYAKNFGIHQAGSLQDSGTPDSGTTSVRQLLDKFASCHPSAPHALRHYRDNLCLLARKD